MFLQPQVGRLLNRPIDFTEIISATSSTGNFLNSSAYLYWSLRGSGARALARRPTVEVGSSITPTSGHIAI